MFFSTFLPILPLVGTNWLFWRPFSLCLPTAFLGGFFFQPFVPVFVPLLFFSDSFGGFLDRVFFAQPLAATWSSSVLFGLSSFFAKKNFGIIVHFCPSTRRICEPAVWCTGFSTPFPLCPFCIPTSTNECQKPERTLQETVRGANFDLF